MNCAHSASMVENEFILRSDNLIVERGGKFYYYPLTIDNSTTYEGSKLFRFFKHPGKYLEGVVVFKRTLYRVTPSDLMRGVVRTSTEISIEDYIRSTQLDIITDTSPEASASPNSSTCAASPERPASPPSVSEDTDAGGLTGLAEVEVSAGIDSVREDQIQSLQHSLLEEEEEEWRVEDSNSV